MHLPFNKRPMYVCGWATAATLLQLNNCNHTVPFSTGTQELCQVLCCQLPAFHCNSPHSTTGQSMWDLWWTKWHWSKFSLNTSVFTCQYKATNAPYSFPHLHGCCGARIAQLVYRHATGWTVWESNPGVGEIFYTYPDQL